MTAGKSAADDDELVLGDEETVKSRYQKNTVAALKSEVHIRESGTEPLD